MTKTRITASMTKAEAIYTMADGNFGAATCMLQMFQHSETALLDILFFDKMEIYGAKIYMLWNDCCGRDMTKLADTIQYLQSNNISKETILENLSRVRAIPFI